MISNFNFSWKNKKGWVSTFAFMIMMLVSGISASLYWIAYDSLHIQQNFFYSALSYYSAETWIEKWLYQFKINPSEESFVWQKELISELKNKKQLEYRDQHFYRLERVIEELIPAWKNIQLFFDSKLNPNITKFHIAYLKRDFTVKPALYSYCYVPKFNTTVEVGVFSTVNEFPGWVSETILANNTNKCEGWYGLASKLSSNTINDPYSTSTKSIAWWRCLLNNKWNVIGATSTWENNFSYAFDDQWNSDISDNKCNLVYGASNDKYFTTDEEVKKKVEWYQRWSTIIDGLDVPAKMTKDTDKIVLEIRAVDEDVSILIWATDDLWVSYDIPWRFINFTATWKASTKAWLENDVYRRMIVKRKINQDLLPVFDFTLFSESEFIK